MTHCPRCGTAFADGQRFCTTCGSPRPEAVVPAARPSFDWMRLLRGNWLGSLYVALATLGTTAVFSLALALLLKPPGLGVKHTLDLTTILATATFGARLHVHGDFDGTRASGSVGTFPLTLTVVVLLVLLVAFRRLVRDYPGPLPALADAVRVGVIVGLGLLVPALIFHGDNERLGHGWTTELTAASHRDVAHYAMSGTEAFFLGLLLTVVPLSLLVLARREWWPQQRLRAVLDVVVPAVQGWFVLLLSLPVAGLVGFLLLGFGKSDVTDNEDTTSLHTILALVFGGLGNGGLYVVSLGAGGSVGGSYSVTGQRADDVSSDSGYEHLWQHVTHDEPGLWGCPVVLLLVLAVCALVVARRSVTPRLVASSLLVWVVGLLVVLPVLVGMSGIHAGADVSEALDVGHVSGSVGAHGVQTTFYVTGVALLVALLVALRHGAEGLRAIGSGLRAAGAALQAGPAPVPSGPPPSGPPPSGPPPSSPPSYGEGPYRVEPPGAPE